LLKRTPPKPASQHAIASAAKRELLKIPVMLTLLKRMLNLFQLAIL